MPLNVEDSIEIISSASSSITLDTEIFLIVLTAKLFRDNVLELSAVSLDEINEID